MVVLTMSVLLPTIQAVGIDLVGHADARRAGRHRRDAAQLKARQRTAVGHQLALALVAPLEAARRAE